MLDSTVERAFSEDRDRRREGLEDLGDYLESMDWDPATIAPILERLIGVLGSESDEELGELILNDLLIAFNRGKRIPASLQPILGYIDRFSDPLIAYSLELLSFSHDPKYRPVLLRYLSHPSEPVRQAAADGLIELSGKTPSD